MVMRTSGRCPEKSRSKLFLAVANFGPHSTFLSSDFAATFTCSFRSHSMCSGSFIGFLKFGPNILTNASYHRQGSKRKQTGCCGTPCLKRVKLATDLANQTESLLFHGSFQDSLHLLLSFGFSQCREPDRILGVGIRPVFQ